MRTNSFAGPCTKCGETVVPGAGTLAREESRGVCRDQQQGRLGEHTRGRWLVTHDVCPRDVPAPLGPVYGPPTWVPVRERIALQLERGNWFMASKEALVHASSSLAEAKERINQSCQGMTMDYMHELHLETTAARLAVELAEEVFAALELVDQ